MPEDSANPMSERANYLSGAAVRRRLLEVGLLDEWTGAITRLDRPAITQLLVRIDVSVAQIESMLEGLESPLAGMTVNERLFHLGILERWDQAVERRDRDAMIRLMEQADVENPDWTVDAILANPSRYSF